MHKSLLAALLLTVLVSSAVAVADETDLNQTVSDLTSQVNDKRRLDRRQAASVEISQCKSWLADAANAIKEERVEQSRRLFVQVRVQLQLIDQLIALAELRHQEQRLNERLDAARQRVARAQRRLKAKEARLARLKAENR